MDMQEMLRRAREMQSKAAEMKKGMDALEVEGQSGGGLVRITLTGAGVCKRVSLDSSLLKAEEREIVEDLIVAAHGDAKGKLDAKVAEEMNRMAGQLGLPPGLGL
jgi:hypothetical protein